MITGSTAFLDALAEGGVSYIFANLGSDHPGLIEAMAQAAAQNRRVPAMLTCPNEMVALSAAHGFAAVSGRAQAVVVHVECGTQALAGAVHNVSRGRIPVLIFAGTSPYTQHGEAKGSRNEYIHWIQDVFDQRGIVRGYVKYDNEIRSAATVKQLVGRALQFAHSEPKGPVYLMGAREVMEASIDESPVTPPRQALSPRALSDEALDVILSDLLAAKRPVVVTSYLGRNPAAVPELVALCERLAIGVIESAPFYVNFPHDHPLYLGNQWNERDRNPALRDADTILILDSDVPWVPLINPPHDQAHIHHLDTDPLKSQMPLAVVERGGCHQVDCATALRQINRRLETAKLPADLIAERRKVRAQAHGARRAALEAREAAAGDVITPEFLVATLRGHLDDETIVLNEAISNYPVVVDHLIMRRPGSIFASGGSSLGWSGGAAIGAKLAAPEKTVVSLVGDGSFLFSVPSSVFWMARQYRTPFLQIILNNGGWKSPKLSTLAVHPDGFASRADEIGVSFGEQPDYAGIALSAGAGFAKTVRRPEDLAGAIAEGLKTVREDKRAALLNVHLPKLCCISPIMRDSDDITIDYGPLPLFAGYHIRKAYSRLFQSFNDMLGEIGLAPGQYSILMLIGRNPGMRQNVLAQAIGIDGSTVVPVTNRFVKLGWLRRTRRKDDRRAYSLNLTPLGQSVLEKAQPIIERHEEALLSRLNKADRKKLIELLTKITAP